MRRIFRPSFELRLAHTGCHDRPWINKTRPECRCTNAPPNILPSKTILPKDDVSAMLYLWVGPGGTVLPSVRSRERERKREKENERKKMKLTPVWMATRWRDALVRPPNPVQSLVGRHPPPSGLTPNRVRSIISLIPFQNVGYSPNVATARRTPRKTSKISLPCTQWSLPNREKKIHSDRPRVINGFVWHRG